MAASCHWAKELPGLKENCEQRIAFIVLLWLHVHSILAGHIWISLSILHWCSGGEHHRILSRTNLIQGVLASDQLVFKNKIYFIYIICNKTLTTEQLGHATSKIIYIMYII